MAVKHAIKKPRLIHRGRRRAKRARTFSTEAAAKAYAESNGVKNYDVVRMRAGLSKKLKIVSK